MNDSNNIKKEEKKGIDLNRKIENIREILKDDKKCKEIAQKLYEYIKN